MWKTLGEFRKLHSDAFKENHKYLCGLNFFQDYLHVRGFVQ